MADTTLNHISVRGISACVPPDIYEISDYSLFGPGEAENFMKTVGVHQRRQARKGLTTSDLCAAAAERLISSLNWDKASIDVLVFVTQSADYIIPATAIILQHRLGLDQHCLAFDINLGCSGYVIGLQTVASLLSEHGIKRAMMLAGDVPSANMSFEDKSTFPLFGDAGSATALEFSENAPSMHFVSASDGSQYDALYIPAGGMRNLASPESFQMKEFPGGIKRNDTHLVLDGLRIFNFSITQVPIQIKALLQKTGHEIDAIDCFFLHQANLIMNETIRKKLRILPEKFPYSIKEFGNTSAGSIPLTICHHLGKTEKTGKMKWLLSGFGIGLSWASVILDIQQALILPVFDYEYEK